MAATVIEVVWGGAFFGPPDKALRLIAPEGEEFRPGGLIGQEESEPYSFSLAQHILDIGNGLLLIHFPGGDGHRLNRFQGVMRIFRDGAGGYISLCPAALEAVLPLGIFIGPGDEDLAGIVESHQILQPAAAAGPVAALAPIIIGVDILHG